MDLGLDDKTQPLSPKENDAGVVLTEEAKRRQRLRSLAIAWALFALVVMFFLVTIVKLRANVASPPF